MSKKQKIEEAPFLVRTGALNEQKPVVPTTLIPKNNIGQSNAEKELRKLIHETLNGYDLLQRSQRNEGYNVMYQKFHSDGFNRMLQQGQTKKRQELLLIKAKALDYANSIPQPDVDLGLLGNDEKVKLKSYATKNLKSCDAYKAELVDEEDAIITALNEWNRKHYVNKIKQEYLKEVLSVLNINVKSKFVAEVIDEYIYDCGKDAYKQPREDDEIIEDVDDDQMFIDNK